MARNESSRGKTSKDLLTLSAARTNAGNRILDHLALRHLWPGTHNAPHNAKQVKRSANNKMEQDKDDENDDNEAKERQRVTL
ncbi:hypothetical protein ACLKA7_015217 [Drosophila subpalustris]